jgi:hypothetical protein
MLSESIIIGLVIFLLCGAVSFYMYVRLSFLEKKVHVMESILVDVRVALDSIMMEHSHPPSVPISHTPVKLSAPVPIAPSESESIPEENFYSSVLEKAHEKEEKTEKEEKLEKTEGVTVEKALESFNQIDLSGTSVQPSVGPNIDAMTRQELVSLAESKGLRVKRSLNRSEVLALLRRSNPAQNDSVSTGAENVSGSAGNTLQAGASFDGSVSVDLDKNGAALEAAL